MIGVVGEFKRCGVRPLIIAFILHRCFHCAFYDAISSVLVNAAMDLMLYYVYDISIIATALTLHRKHTPL